MTTEHKLYDTVVINYDSIYYTLNGKYHRTDGPAYIYYNADETLNCECYILNDKYHRTDGPAVIYYNRDGGIYSEHYFLNGQNHRVDGPAAIYYNKDGSINIVIYWLYGKTLSKDEFLEQQQNFAGKLK